MTDPILTERQTIEPIPQSLRDAEAAADALIAQQGKSLNTEATPPAEPVAAPTPASDLTLAPTNLMPLNPQPVTPDTSFEAKYKVLKGKYDKEVNADVSGLQARVDSDRKLIDSLVTQVDRLTLAVQTASPAAPDIPSENTAQPAPGKLNPEDYEHYGEEIVSLVKSNNTLIDQLGKTDMSILSRLDLLDDKIATSKVVSFKEKLTELVPDWEALNLDREGFVAWTVSTIEPYSGKSMNEILNTQWAAGDLQKTAQIFTTYKSQIATAAERNPSIPQPTLEEQMVPDTATGVPTPEKGKVVRVTEAELEAAAKKYQSDTTPANEAEYERLYKLYSEQQRNLRAA